MRARLAKSLGERCKNIEIWMNITFGNLQIIVIVLTKSFVLIFLAYFLGQSHLMLAVKQKLFRQTQKAFLKPSNVSRLSSDGSALFKSVILVASFLHTHHCLHKDIIWMSLVGFAKLSESRSTWKEPRSFHQCLINFIGRGRHTNMRNISTPCSALMMSNMVEDVSA